MSFNTYEFLGSLLQSASQAVAARGGAAAASFLLSSLRLSFRKRTAALADADAVSFLQSLGAIGPDVLRRLVHERLKGLEPPVHPNAREDLAALLIGLSRGASLLNTRGDPRTAFVHAKDVLARLVGETNLLRSAGDKVAPNHDWVVRQFLGMGSFGEVWLATNSRAPNWSNRAYKFFREDARESLEREKDALVAVAERLKGMPNVAPHVVQLIDITVPPRGEPFLAFEYVAGGSLLDWLTNPDRASKPIPRAPVMRGIVRTMAAVHQQGIYHLDLKPANILLTPGPDVQPKIADFGLSRVGPTEPGTEAFRAGTPLYLPPETQGQELGQRPALCDVFALGVIWYQLLVEKVDRPPYDFADELRTAGVDGQTIRLIQRCLAHADRRFPDAAALADHMGQVDLPVWDPAPAGLFDVSQLVRENIGRAE